MALDIQKLRDWQPADQTRRIYTIDAHTAGEPLRVIYDGFPQLSGKTILEKRRQAREKYDDLRRALMWEPRGHADMYGCILTEAVTDEADFGVLFTHNEGYSTMCGHGIIGVTRVVLETGAMPLQEPVTMVKIDTPAGLVTAFADVENGKVRRVRFRNVPSFVFKQDVRLKVDGIGPLVCDIAFGGAFYAFVDADKLGLPMDAAHYRQLIEWGMAIKREVMHTTEIVHPVDRDLGFLYGTIFTGKAHRKDMDSRNVCIFAEGEVDRSPTGTGVSARMALHFAKGDIAAGEEMKIESIIGSGFTGKVAETTSFAGYPAVIPEVSGTAHITGRHSFIIDKEDDLNKGFILR